MNNLSFKAFLPYITAILIFIIISLAYLNPLLEGKKLSQADITRYQGMSKEVNDYREATGEEALWTNSMFSGMPAYQISVKYKGNLMRFFDRIFILGLPHPASLVFLYMLGFFILLLTLKIDPWLSIVGAIAFGLSSYFFIILEAGHNSKAHAIGYMAPTLAGILLTYRGKYVLGGILTLLFMALEIRAGHPQITYYLFLLLLVFGIFELVNTIKTKNYQPFLKATAIVILAVGLGLLTHITNLWATYEYGNYTIRGKSELSTDQENRTSGLDKDYATQWSYGKAETFSLMIPNVKGGASVPLASNKKAMEKVDANWKTAIAQNRVYQYWGDQPFTSGPVYVGAFILFFFIYGLFIVKGRMKWWLLTGTILSILLSWGKNFMPLTEFFLDYFPFYNKFRAVSMTLVIAELTIPLLAIIALNKIIKNPAIIKEKLNLSSVKINPLYISMGLTGGLALLFALLPTAFFNFLSSYETESIRQQIATNPEYATQIQDFYGNVETARISVFKSDALRSFAFILLAGAAIIAFAYGKLKKNVLIAVIAVLLLIDLWTIDKRYLNNDNFVKKSKIEKPYTKTTADELILKDTDPYYRVLNLTQSPFADPATSYFHKSIGGYHGAKLRRYQELYDHHIEGKFNMGVLNMLNTKYIIQPGENNKPQVYPNMQALGNAWFVNKIEYVQNADEELEALGTLNPSTTAVVDAKFKDVINGFEPVYDSTALIKLVEYKPNKLFYQTNTHKDQLVVFSEIYYDKGWNAYVDEELVPHFRANYVLRAMILPAGKHKLEFKFEPRVYAIGEKVSLASSLIVILLVLGGLYLEIKKYINTKNAEE
jgi:hypothetical protein